MHQYTHNKLFAMVQYAINNPQKIIKSTVLLTLFMCVFLPFASIDVDPENMLAHDEPTRVFHNQMKKQMDINDLIVIGIENPNHPSGVFNPQSLNHIFEFANHLKTIKWTDKQLEQKQGIITHNILSPNQVDAIIAGEPGVITFERLMSAPISTQQQAEQIKQRALDNPFLAGTMVSADEKSLALYVPISSKSVSAQIYKLLNAHLEKTHLKNTNGDLIYHITGLPLAEDVFGIDMFIQMAISAPLAMIFIFVLILYFFRNARIGISALIVAMASVLITMGAFVAFGNTIHIMSSMIAIFLMPIAVLDAIHILSMFFDMYRDESQKKATLMTVMSDLFKPMMNTSLTSAAGFFSLYLAPIPPIQVFGIFVGVGILIAWLLSMTLIPAYIMLLKPQHLKGFGSHSNSPVLSRLLQHLGQWSFNYSKTLLLFITIIVSASIYGIGFIKVNDNPMKWLHPTHPIRVADDFINEEFGGNYLVYLSLSGTASSDSSAMMQLNQQLQTMPKSPVTNSTIEQIKQLSTLDISDAEKINRLWQFTHAQKSSVNNSTTNDQNTMEDELDDIFAEEDTDTQNQDQWSNIQNMISDVRQVREVFKRPDVLRYIEQLQAHVDQQKLVGKSNSLADLVKKLNKELYNSDPQRYVIPETAAQVSEVLTTFENSHEPFRLWHAVTQDFATTNMWFQVKSGDNQDINDIVNHINAYITKNPPPIVLKHDYFGLSFINTVWQQKMVSGMSDALYGSIIVVLLMMILLFRSVIWGVISIIPLSVTMVMIYGVIGIMGKDYDMPVAVLSALALGLSVDFAIHFLTHARQKIADTGSWKMALSDIYNEPAKAIYRNIIIIAIGFTPLLLAALVPYQTVGMLMASIMLVSGFATLIILPAVLRLLNHKKTATTSITEIREY